MKKLILAAVAAMFIAGSAQAAEVSVGYRDSDTYIVSASVSKQINSRFDVDVAGHLYDDSQKLEVGTTFNSGNYSVRAAVGGLFQNDGTDLPFYKVTPAVTLDVPYTDTFKVFAEYENSFNLSGYETYGVGAVAGWNVGGVTLNAGVQTNYGDAEYVEYTVGVSKAF